jgi:hypothetical protein
MAVFQNENRRHLMEKLNRTSMTNTLHRGDTSWTLPVEDHARRFAGSVALPFFKSKKDLQTLQFGVNIYHRSSLTPRTCKKMGSKVHELGVYLCRQCHP